MDYRDSEPTCEESKCKDTNMINNNYENFSMFCKKNFYLVFLIYLLSVVKGQVARDVYRVGWHVQWERGKLVFSTTCQALFERLLTHVYLHVNICSL